MKITITEKRAQLLKLWCAVNLLNDERGYNASLVMGIPDGTSFRELFDDLSYGEYDECIDELLSLYRLVLKRYEDGGYYYHGNYTDDREQALKWAYVLPEKIYKKKYSV